MRLDEPGRNPNVGVDPLTVQPDRHVGLDVGALDEPGPVEGIVVDDPVAAHDLRAEHLDELGVGCCPVRAGGDEHDDVLGAKSGQLGQDDRQHGPTGHRTRDVTNRNGHCLTRLGQVPERARADRVPNRVPDSARLVRQPDDIGRLDYGRAVVGKLHGQVAAAVGKVDVHH